MLPMVVISNCYFLFLLGFSFSPFHWRFHLTCSWNKISYPKFILDVMILFPVVEQCLLNRNVISVNPQNTSNLSESEVKKNLRDIFEEYYRLKRNYIREETVFSETWRLYQQVLLVIVVTICIDPIVRIRIMTPCYPLCHILFCGYFY